MEVMRLRQLLEVPQAADKERGAWLEADSLFDLCVFAQWYRFAIRLPLFIFRFFPISVLFRLLYAFAITFRPRLPPS